MSNKLPIFLEGYDWFAALESWRAELKDTERRHWTLAPYSLSFRVSLTWNMNGQCAALDHCSPTVQEATHVVLQEFRRLERMRDGE
jgi:hypothetical protein